MPKITDFFARSNPAQNQDDVPQFVESIVPQFGALHQK